MRTRRVEVIVLACVIVVLALLGFVASRSRRNYGQTECVYNLKMIHLDYVNYLTDHGKFVTQVSSNQGGTMEFRDQAANAAVHFQPMVLGQNPVQREAPIHYLVCPLDKSVKPAKPDRLTDANVSYFLSLNPPSENAHWILSGNRNLSLTTEPNPNVSQTRKAAWNPAPGLHGETGYLLFLDGAVTRVDSVGLEKFFNQGSNSTNRIAIPKSD